MSFPLVSCLMPVYNCERYAEEAVHSILQQTYSNFELIIIDDASTDGTAAVVKNIVDDRIVFIQKPANSGIADTLNIGLERAKGKYIARMDGDDISLPDRFAKQVSFLEENSSVIVLGSSYSIIGREQVVNHPTDHDAIKVFLLNGSYIAHPSVFIRKEIIDKYAVRYSSEMVPAEDYWLWVQLSQYGELANLPEPLLAYRVHENQTSSKRAITQAELADKVRLEMLNYLCDAFAITDEDKSVHLALIKNELNVHVSLSKVVAWKGFLLKTNIGRKIFDQNALSTFLNDCERKYVNNYLFHNSNHSLRNLLFVLKNREKLISDISTSGILRLVSSYGKKKVRSKLASAKSRLQSNVQSKSHYFYQVYLNPSQRKAIKNYKSIPIIINNYNQYKYLLLLVASLKQRGYENIHILDNASTYPPLLEYYKTTDVNVMRLGENVGHMAFWKVKGVLDRFKDQYYVLTDPDIVLGEDCPDDFLKTFLKVLIKFPKVTKVGCALRLDNIPDHYPLKEKVLKWEEQFWANRVFDNAFHTYIDTTFALYRPNYITNENASHAFYSGIRMAGKYTAIHGGWYQDPENLSEEEIYYKQTANESASWSLQPNGQPKTSTLKYL